MYNEQYTIGYLTIFQQVQVDMEFAQSMFELHKKVKPTDVVLGW